MNALAPLIAKAQKLPAGSDYRAVLRALKKKQISNARCCRCTPSGSRRWRTSSRREHVVTLPQRKASIRLASEAESAMQPAPHMSPPRLIGNTGEYGEFVLPLSSRPARPGRRTSGPTTSPSTPRTWTLTVHEARPGHELQFPRMIESGVSHRPRGVRLQQRQRRGLGAVRRVRDEALPPARRPAGVAPAPDAARGAGVPRPDAEPRPDHPRAGAARPDGGRGALRGNGQAGGGPVHLPRAGAGDVLLRRLPVDARDTASGRSSRSVGASTGSASTTSSSRRGCCRRTSGCTR